MTSYVAGLNPFDLETVDSPEMPQTRPDMAATSVPAHISFTSSCHTDDAPYVQSAPPAAVDPPLPHPADADAVPLSSPPLQPPKPVAHKPDSKSTTTDRNADATTTPPHPADADAVSVLSNPVVSDPVSTSNRTPPSFVIQPPLDTHVTYFWDWIAHNFSTCCSAAFQTFMTRSLNCFTIDDFTSTVTTYDPAFLISRFGAEVCDTWRSCFIDMHIIFNFVLKCFWHDPSIQDITSVPYSSWCRHRSKVFSPTCNFFPDSVTFVNAQTRALPDKHRASSQRSSASSERSFASATQPPPYTPVSPAVLNHGSLYPNQSAGRTSHSWGLRSPGPHSYHSPPP
jgi:hypothetical protein